MAIDQVINYDLNPPKGAEKIFFNTMMFIVITAIVSLVFVGPFLLISGGPRNSDSFSPFNLMLGLDTRLLLEVFGVSALGIFISIIVETVFKDQTSKREGEHIQRPLWIVVDMTIFALSMIGFAITMIPLVVKGIDGILNWLTSVSWLNEFSDGAMVYIIGYYAFLAVTLFFAWIAWFVFVRIRERKANLNKLKGKLLSKLWQYFVADMFSVINRKDKDLKLEAEAYTIMVFVRTIVGWFALFTFMIAVDMGMRYIFS